jgi:hypothetical protein
MAKNNAPAGRIFLLGLIHDLKLYCNKTESLQRTSLLCLHRIWLLALSEVFILPHILNFSPETMIYLFSMPCHWMFLCLSCKNYGLAVEEQGAGFCIALTPTDTKSTGPASCYTSWRV